jgi:hypothetical protein
MDLTEVVGVWDAVPEAHARDMARARAKRALKDTANKGPADVDREVERGVNDIDLIDGRDWDFIDLTVDDGNDFIDLTVENDK